jgi:hypothetical protein
MTLAETCRWHAFGFGFDVPGPPTQLGLTIRGTDADRR